VRLRIAQRHIARADCPHTRQAESAQGDTTKARGPATIALATIFALLGLVPWPGCRTPLERAAWLNDGSVRVPDAFAVLFLVDGMSADVTERLLNEGRLPNIERIFVRGGVVVRNAVASMPGATYANTASIITGLFPGHHGILGNQWFDPSDGTWGDYRHATTYLDVNDDLDATTIFDLLGDELTVNVQGHTHRGATVNELHLVRSGWDWVLKRYSQVDQRVGRAALDIAEHARWAGRWPALTMLYFPGVDEHAHRFGAASPQYQRAIMDVDEAVGRFTSDLRRLGLLDRCYLVLVSDHGMTTAQSHTDVAAWLRRCRGWRVRDHLPALARWFDGRMPLPGDDAVYIESGGRCAHLHLRGLSGWRQRVSTEVIDAAVRGSCGRPPMTKLPGVHLVCAWHAEGQVSVYTPAGTALLSRRETDFGAEYSAIVTSGDPPAVSSALGLPASLAQGEWLSGREWLARTSGGAHPDLVPQIVEMFASRRTGDVVLFADQDAMFHPCWRGGHGSTFRDDMRVPLFFSGPDLQKGVQLPLARSVDVAPTLMDLLGRSVDPDRTRFDGESLAPLLRPD